MDKKNKNQSNQNQNQKANKAEAKRKEVKIDISCEGCTAKICFSDFKGVEDAKKVMAMFNLILMEPTLPQKTKNVSPLPPKKDSKPQKKDQDIKPKDKEAPVTTALLKLSQRCLCQGCSEKIRKLVWGTKGVQKMTLDKEKQLVNVKGTMDAKALAASLKKMLKSQVEVVPPEKKKEGGGDGDKKDKHGKKDGGGGGEKKGGA